MSEIDPRIEKIIKQITDYEKPLEGKTVCYDYKKIDDWTLEEGFKLLTFPFETCPPDLFAMDSPIKIGFLMDNRKFNIVRRAIESKKLKIRHESEELLSRWKNDVDRGVKTDSLNSFWEGCCWKLKVNPFEFLEFIKDKKLFGIPDELRFSKLSLDAGEYSYAWQDEVSENSCSSNHLDLDYDTKLNGKERRELGRLRAEKKTIDATVKAAIKVGRFVQTKINDDKKIVKREIQDLVYKFNKNLPSTRIDFIWSSIEEDVKKGSGRPKKTEP